MDEELIYCKKMTIKSLLYFHMKTNLKILKTRVSCKGTYSSIKI